MDIIHSLQGEVTTMQGEIRTLYKEVNELAFQASCKTVDETFSSETSKTTVIQTINETQLQWNGFKPRKKESYVDNYQSKTSEHA